MTYESRLQGKKKQALQTKTKIAHAFVKLVEKNNYNEITIYELLDQAQVSRRTFYRHFSSKDELMDYCLMLLVQDYYQERERFLNCKQSHDVFTITLRFMHNRRLFLRSLILSGQFDKFSAHFNDHSTEIFNTFDLPWNLREDIDIDHAGYMSKVLVGAYMNVIRYWLVKENPEAPEKVADDFVKLFSAIPMYFVEKADATNSADDSSK